MISKLTLVVDFDTVRKLENDFHQVITMQPWEHGGASVEKGNYISYLGAAYLVDDKPVSGEDNVYLPTRTSSFAMNPYSCLRQLCEVAMQEQIKVTVDGSQVWVHFPPKVTDKTGNNFDSAIAYGSHHYAKPRIYGLGENVFLNAFDGLLTHHKMGSLEDMVSEFIV